MTDRKNDSGSSAVEELRRRAERYYAKSYEIDHSDEYESNRLAHLAEGIEEAIEHLEAAKDMDSGSVDRDDLPELARRIRVLADEVRGKRDDGYILTGTCLALRAVADRLDDKASGGRSIDRDLAAQLRAIADEMPTEHSSDIEVVRRAAERVFAQTLGRRSMFDADELERLHRWAIHAHDCGYRSSPKGRRLFDKLDLLRTRERERPRMTEQVSVDLEEFAERWEATAKNIEGDGEYCDGMAEGIRAVLKCMKIEGFRDTEENPVGHGVDDG